MSIRLIVTRGFGNGTFLGTIKDVVTRGYSIGADIAVPLRRTLTVQSDSRTVTPSVDGRTLTPGRDGRAITVN